MTSSSVNSASDGSSVPLPKDVREENTAFTTIYEQGKMIYDGATARGADADPQAAVKRAAAADGAAPSSLNEMLKWGISNSSPEEFKKMAESGRKPTQMDREVMDMLLGEPIVAKMRACLSKVPQSAGAEPPEGLDAALAALEELEYYVEDIDNAVDMAKIGGLQQLLPCIAEQGADPELREAACGVVAAAVQNNPKVQDACVAQNALDVLLSLLRGEDEAETLPVRRKALLATSALVRTCAPALEQLMAAADGVATLVRLGAHADAKLRRRALFLLLNLSRESLPLAARLPPVPHLCPTLVEAACDADEDTREQALQLLLLLIETDGASAMRSGLLQADAMARLAKTAADARMVGEAEGNPEHAAHLRMLLAWLSGAD